MSIVSRFAGKSPACCAVCRRHADGIAYAPNNRGPFIWVCDDTECIRLAKEVYKMPKDILDTVERESMLAGGDAAGAYLDEIGKTDLIKLTADEWEEFLRRTLITYEKKMRELADPPSRTPY